MAGVVRQPQPSGYSGMLWDPATQSYVPLPPTQSTQPGNDGSDPYSQRATRALEGETSFQTGLDQNAQTYDFNLQNARTLENQRNTMFGKLNSMIDGLSTSGTGWPTVPMSGSFNFGAPSVSSFPGIAGSNPRKPVSFNPSSSAIDNGAALHAAQSADFGRAKAKAGAMGRASLEGLDANLADRGILGSGTEGRGLVDRLAAATNPLSDINAQQLHENANIDEANANRIAAGDQTNYQGQIAQRGQDIGANEANVNAQLAERGQNIGAQMQGQDLALRGQSQQFSQQYALAALRQQQQLAMTQMLRDAMNGLNRGLY